MINKGKQKPRIGEILVNYGLISYEQLTRALDRQIQSGQRLGSILGEMGYLDTDTLLNVLSNQCGLPFVNLFEVHVPPEILKLLPFDQVKSFHVLPFRKTDTTVSVAMVDPGDGTALRNIESLIGGNVKPFIVPHYQMDKAISCFEQEGYGANPFEGEKLRDEKAQVEAGVPGIYTLFKLLSDFRATDLHLTAGAPPGMRINSELRKLSMPNISPAQMKDFIAEILTKEQMETFERERELDFVISLSDIGRFRMNIYRQRNSVSLSARLIYEQIPSTTDLGLPEWIADYVLRPHGLVLISGSAGQGKTTSVAALVNIINTRRNCNIVTLEDPIEYLHKHKKSNVNQREIGIDTGSFSAGLKHVLRQDPDVIVIGDLKDPESVAFALSAAENGKLVIAAMHSLNSVTSINRIVNIFPEHQLPRIRMQLADTLLLLFSQKLVPGREGAERVLAYEKLINSSRVANLIRDGKTSNIRSLMQVGADDALSMDGCIAGLCFEGKVSFEDGLRFADNPASYQELIRKGKF
jgi:twitching motility protein PilT